MYLVELYLGELSKVRDRKTIERIFLPAFLARGVKAVRPAVSL
jgi:hypothetical protein